MNIYRYMIHRHPPSETKLHTKFRSMIRSVRLIMFFEQFYRNTYTQHFLILNDDVKNFMLLVAFILGNLLITCLEVKQNIKLSN